MKRHVNQCFRFNRDPAFKERVFCEVGYHFFVFVLSKNVRLFFSDALQDWCGDWDWQCWQWRWHQQTEVVSTTSHCPIERQDARLSRRQGCNWRCLFEWPVGRWPKSHEQPDGHSDAFPAVEDSLHVWHKGFFPPSESTPWWCWSIQIFVVQGSKSLPCHHLSVSLPRLRKPF